MVAMVCVHAQDAPGWGDDINLMRYMRVITSFLLEQRAKVRTMCQDAAGKLLYQAVLVPQLAQFHCAWGTTSLQLVLLAEPAALLTFHCCSTMLSLQDFEKLAGSRTLDETVMCGVLEHSITACLYFLPPHRMKKVDLILMAAISRMVRKILCLRPPSGFCQSVLVAIKRCQLHSVTAFCHLSLDFNRGTLRRVATNCLLFLWPLPARSL